MNTGVTGFFLLKFISFFRAAQSTSNRKWSLKMWTWERTRISAKKSQDQEVKINFMCLVSKIEIRKIHLDFQRNFFVMWEQYQIGRKIGGDLLVSLALGAWPMVAWRRAEASRAEAARRLLRIVPAPGQKWSALNSCKGSVLLKGCKVLGDPSLCSWGLACRARSSVLFWIVYFRRTKC